VIEKSRYGLTPHRNLEHSRGQTGRISLLRSLARSLPPSIHAPTQSRGRRLDWDAAVSIARERGATSDFSGHRDFHESGRDKGATSDSTPFSSSVASPLLGLSQVGLCYRQTSCRIYHLGPDNSCDSQARPSVGFEREIVLFVCMHHC